jgi:hypothetical protein
MPTVTIPRGDVTREEVCEALRTGLGPRYHVLPGMQVTFGFAEPEPGRPDTIVVGTGSNRFWRTQLQIERRGGQTRIQVMPPCPIQIKLINMLGVARKVRRVLEQALDLEGSREVPVPPG